MNTLLRAFSPRDNLARLLNPPPAGFRTIDGLRAVAILWVVTMHCAWFHFPFMSPPEFTRFLDSVPSWIIGGPFGVDIFFVISGFLIGCLLMKEHEATGSIRIGRFYGRRFLRLMPPYLVAMGIYAVLIGQNRDMLWSNLLYINNFIPGARQAMPWTWSLAIEEQFYFTFPLFLVFVFYRLRHHRATLLLGLTASSLVIRAAITLANDVYLPVPWSLGVTDERFLVWAEALYIKPQARFGCLMLGVLAAWYFTQGMAEKFFARRGVLADVLAGLSALTLVGIVAAPIHVAAPRWDPVLSLITLSTYQDLLGAATAYLLLYSLYPKSAVGRAVARVLSARFLYVVAQLAYSAYLLNPMVLVVLYGAGTLAVYPMAVRYGLGILSTFVAAFVLYILIERPFMNLREVRWRWERVPAGVAGPSRASAG